MILIWYSEEELLEQLREFASDRGEAPTRDDLDKAEDYPSSETYRTRFGSWNQAKEAAGIAEHLEKDKIFSEQELIQDLQDVADKLDGNLSQQEYSQRGEYSTTVYKRRFGSWNQAKKEAGLEIHEYTRQELLKHLQELEDELGEPPTKKDLDSVDGPSSMTYYNKFESLSEAKKQAGLSKGDEN